MTNLSTLDLQNLRQAYAQSASDPQVQQFFQKAAQSASQAKEQLMQFLQ